MGKKIWWFLKKLKIRLLYDLEILLLGKPKRIQNKNSNKNLDVSIHSSVTYSLIAKNREQPKCSSIDEWMHKM